MSGYEIATIVLGVLTAISSVGWGRLWRKGRKIVSEAKEVASEYESAVEDGKITDEEKRKIGESVIEIVKNASDIWQVMENLVLRIASVVREKKRQPRVR